jgi:hypothetical protein
MEEDKVSIGRKKNTPVRGGEGAITMFIDTCPFAM